MPERGAPPREGRADGESLREGRAAPERREVAERGAPPRAELPRAEDGREAPALRRADGFDAAGRDALEAEEADFWREFDAMSLPHLLLDVPHQRRHVGGSGGTVVHDEVRMLDRKSTRLNSSHWS